MIEIKNISKSFDGKPVLRDISLSIPEASSQVIIGTSGCGKTVLLRCIIGLIKPDAGSIYVNGQNIVQLPRKELYEVRKKFGMLFQGAALFDSMTVEENISLPLREHTCLSQREIDDKVAEKLELVGLPDTQKKKPAELSGGMKKRVGLARAIVMDPEFVLFDEPTTGLDPIRSDSINHLINETRNRLGITTIVVTHDMVSAQTVGDRAAMISEGRIIFDGDMKSLYQTSDPAVKQFIEGKADL